MEFVNSVDTWVAPYSIKIMDKFLDEKYYSFIQNMIKERNFVEATQGVGGKNIVQKQHKIRLDYTLNNYECSVIDHEFLEKADCDCNLRERWRLLYYNGDNDEKAFRDAHTDWTHYSCHRRMSIIIGISDPSDYEGGELVFRNNNLKYKIGKGSAVIFDSKLLHEVLPVTGGKRYVLQAFLFNDSGYSFKKEKNGLQHFKLLGNKSNIDSLNNKVEEVSNNKFNSLHNRNAAHSRIKSIDDSFIGTYKYSADLNNYLENNKHIHCYTWHKPEHHNKKWAGRAYGWSIDECKKRGRIDPISWPKETNVISGILTPINKKTNNGPKTITTISTDGGPGNQIVGIKELIIMSTILKRDLIIPPILQHYVLNRKYRGSSEINCKIWNFDEIFHYSGNYKNLMDNIDCIKDDTCYYLKRQDIDNPLRMEKMLNPNFSNKFVLNKRNFQSLNDYDELKEKEDDNMVVYNLYNNTAISTCFWNGCDTCPFNDCFIDLYKNICNNLDFSNKIKQFGDDYIKTKFQDNEFICLHIRYPDYINTNNDIKEINKLYNEIDINELIIYLCDKNKIDRNNVFIATCNKPKILASDLKNYNILEEDQKYNELESFIEQYIACKSNYFIYTGGIHAKPNHTHLRSTWSSFVLDYRSFKLNKNLDTNIYLTKHFQEKNEEKNENNFIDLD